MNDFRGIFKLLCPVSLKVTVIFVSLSMSQIDHIAAQTFEPD